MRDQTVWRWKPRTDGIRYVAESDPEVLCKLNGKPNIAAIARAAQIEKSALGRIFNGNRPWAGETVARKVARVAAEPRNIPLEEALSAIFEAVEVVVGS